MIIANCRTYHAVTVKKNILRLPDNKSIFKIYYLSVIGRDMPEQFEWEHSLCTSEDFEKVFLSGNHEGIGFCTVFPHVTKIFRFSPYAETMLDVSEFNTKDMNPKDCSREDGSHEFACYAEAIISTDEFIAWANSESVEDYLAYSCNKTDFPFNNNTKLAKYW